MVHPYLQAGYERVQCLKELKKSIRDGQSFSVDGKFYVAEEITNIKGAE